MQKLISKYGLAAHLALVAVAPFFLTPSAVIWLSVLCAVWIVMEPSRFGDEMLHDARRRVANAVAADPLFWAMLLLVGVAVVRMLNVGVSMAYDAEMGQWSISSAGMPLIPGSVEGTGYPLVGCTVAALVVVQGCRHCLGRSARGAFALIASLLSGAGAYVWALLYCEGSESARSAVDWALTNPDFEGCVYGIFLLCAIVALVAAFEARWLKVMPLTILAGSGNLLGLFLFSPPAVAAAYVAAALLLIIYSFVYLRIRLGRTTEFKFAVFIGLAIALAVLAAEGLLSAKFIESRIAPYTTGAFVPAGYLELRGVLSEISMRVWKSSPWIGYGHGSFPLVLQFHATPADWQVVTPLQKSVPNGYWMLLVERGAVGAFLLAVPVILLAITYVRRLIGGVVLALPHPQAWVGLLVVILAIVETLIDVSFLAPGAAVALVSVFSLSATAFPKETRSHG